MRVLQSPFALGASPACEFATDKNPVRKFRLYLARFQSRPPAMGLVLIGRPGIGETVLRDRMVRIEAAKERSPFASKAAHFILRRLRALSGLVPALRPAGEEIAVGLNEAIRSGPGRGEIEAAVFSVPEDDHYSAALTASLHLRFWVTSGRDLSDARNADTDHHEGNDNQTNIQFAEVSHRFKH